MKHKGGPFAGAGGRMSFRILLGFSFVRSFIVSALIAQGKALCRGRGRWKDVAGGGGTNALPLTNLAANGGHATRPDTPRYNF